MKSLLSLACLSAALTLSACGGGSDDKGPQVASPAALKTTDTVVGTGATAATGNRVQVNYTGWLYNPAMTDAKGEKFDASVAGKPFTFVIGATTGNDAAIAGFSQGVTGMKVGGKRNVQIPASLGYGSAGVPGHIPGNSGLVFDIELVKICATAAC